MEKRKNIKKIILSEFIKKNRAIDIIIKLLIFLKVFLEISIAWVLQQTVNLIADSESAGELIRLVGKAAVVIAVINGIGFLLQKLQNLFLMKFKVFLKNEMFNELLKKDVVEYEKRSSGEYISVFQTDVQRLSLNYVNSIWMIIESVCMCIMGIISMFSMSVKLSLIIILIQFIPVSVTLIQGKKLKLIEKKSSESRSVFNSHVQDYLNGFRIIKSFSSEKLFQDKFATHSITVEKNDKEYRDKSIFVSLVNSSANFIMIVCLFLIGGMETIKGNIQIGTVIACFELLNMISSPLSSLSVQINVARTSESLFNRIYEMFYKRTDESRNKRTESLSGVDRIELKNVSFSYDNKEVISDISCVFEKGRKYAIVGNSGSGKSTLIKLITGSYDNYEGEILLNGKEICKINASDINNEIALVQQDVFVFNDTVINNITLDSCFPQNEIDRVLKMAGLTDFIKSHGENYKCGENGINISGGEKQRISISRALLKSSDVIVFDEATSALDNITASEIDRIIMSLDQICISVTHRMSIDLLRQYDKIYVLDKGTICESGTADELMEKGEVFKKLYNTAFTQK